MKSPRCVASLAVVVLSIASACLAAQRRGPFNEPPRSVRSRSFDQQHIRLELDFNWQRREVRGRAVHTLTPFGPLQKIEFDAVDMKIEAVALADEKGSPRNKKLAFQSRDGKLAVTLDRSYQAGEVIRLAIDYRITEPERGVFFVLPDENRPSDVKMVWTHSEPIEARYWFPCLDSPADRVTSEILVTVPDGFFVLSNGVLAGKKKNADGRRTWHWVQKQSHVTYLLSVVAGEFEAYRQEWDGIPVISYVPKGRLADAARSFEKTPAMVKFFSEKIGYRYPWPKCSRICVDQYGGGGMEHTSATTLTLRTLHDERAHLDTSSDGLVSHELAHQWWGNLLTCKDWAELWLNESFATYFAALWCEHDLGADEFAWKLHGEAESYFSEDEERYRRPIVTYRYAAPRNMFDRHSYPKGGRVLHMLRFVLGEEAFWKALGHYCRKHEFGVVETADFRTAIEESTGQGLNWFFDQWIYHGGHPEYEVAYRWDEAQKMVTLTVKQTQKVDDLTPLFRMPVEIELVTARETTLRRVTVSKAEETFHFALPQRPRRVCFDPRDWILKKLDFKKSKEEWLDQAVHERHMMCRVRAVEALAEFDRDHDVLAVLAIVAREDKFWAVRQEAVKSLGKFQGEPIPSVGQAFTSPNGQAALRRAAREDPKSLVRREAIKSLAAFPHQQTRRTLREVVRHDRSYYAIAEALRSLVKVDRTNCRVDLLAAVPQPSHREVILKAAADGLADLEDSGAVEQFLAVLDTSPNPDRRAAVMSALARLGRGDAKITEAIGRHLDDVRRQVRSAACEALGKTGDPAAIELLLARRGRERSSRVVRTIDQGLAALREGQKDLDEVQRQVEALQKDNRELKQRLKKLEEAAAADK